MPVNYWGMTPEVNAIRLTTGPGAAAMAPVVAAYTAAGTTHMQQGAQMMATAATTAAGSWQGVGGSAMMAAALPKSEWQIEAGAHAAKASCLIGEAAAAHSAAVAATIPYPVVIANRIREATLQATNIIGQNTPAIAEADVEYAEFHAQNATAMTGYATAAAGIASGLSVPLTPPVAAGANPAGMAAGLAGMGASAGQFGAQATMQGLSAPLQAAGQAVSSAAPAALSAATSAGSTGSSGAEGGDVGTMGNPQLGQPGGSDLLGSSQSMMGMASSLPQMAQGMTQPLTQLAQAPMQMGGQISGLMSGMGGMGGGPGGGLTASSPGANLASSMNGVSGAFNPSGGGVSAALTKPAGMGSSGPIGMPSAWWGPASAADGAGATGQNKPTAAARPGMPAMGGTPMGSGGSGMGMMPMGAAQAGQRRDQGTGRGEDDTSLSVVLEDADAIPILTANGVVYTDGGG
jgi:PPE-repeat protein